MKREFVVVKIFISNLFAMLILFLFLWALPCRGEDTPNQFMAPNLPSLGTYQEEYYQTNINKNKQLTLAYNMITDLEFEKALVELDKVVKNPKAGPAIRSEAYTFMGYCYLNLRQPEKTMEALNKALKLNPKNPMPYFFIAHEYFLKGDIERTKENLKKAIEIHPKFISAMRMLAETYKDEGNVAESVKYYKKIVEYLPNSGYYRYQYYKANEALGDYRESAETLKAMIRLQPGFMLNYIRLGEIYIKLGELDQALEQFNYVKQVEPKNYRAYEGRGKILLKKGLLDDAMKEAKIADELKPDNNFVRMLILDIKAQKEKGIIEMRNKLLMAGGILLLLGLVAYFYHAHQRKLFVLSVIQKFNSAVDEIYDLDTMTNFILNFFTDLGRSPRGIFLLFNRQNNQLTAKEVTGFSPGDMGLNLFAGTDITNWLEGVKKDLLTLEQAGKDPLFEQVFPSLMARLVEMEFKYLLPLRERNTFIGFLVLDNFNVGSRFLPFEADLISPLSSTSAQSLASLTLYETSVSDDLTGLFNKRYFLQNLSAELKRAERYGQPVSLITFDIDNFKSLNDNFGHPQGDQVLNELGKIVRNSLRVGIDVAARTGGEEFCLILPATDVEKAQIAAERVRKACYENDFPGFPEGVRMRVTISLGIATYPVHATTEAGLIKKADEALYMAKKSGKNKVCIIEQVQDPGFLLDQETEPSKTRKPISNSLLDETGLFSRGYFDERFSGEVGRAERHSRPCSLLLIRPDIKLSESEKLGIYKQISKIFQNNLRRGIDVPSRFDRETIAVLLPETDHNKATIIARRLKQVIDRKELQADGGKVTFSVGISNYPNLGRTEESFMESARQALKMCQQMGGDRALIATPI